MRTSGSTCARTGSRTACSKPTKRSSKRPATLGVASSPSPPPSPQSATAAGRTSVRNKGRWYDFLQAVSLLHSLERRRAQTGSGEPPPVTAKRDDLLRIPLDRYKALAPRVEAGFVAAGKLLFGQRVYGVKDLPYQSQLLPLAAILADLGPKADGVDGSRSRRR